MPQTDIEMQTPQGPVVLATYVSPDQLGVWHMDPGIGNFSSYRSILTSKRSLADIAADPEANLTVGLFGGDTVVGYCVRRPPAEGERWAEMDPPILHEVFGEIGRGWRDLKLMKPMLGEVVLEPDNERRILYIVGYSWHWDLDHTKKTVQEYRETIIHLLTPLGFRQYPTNEPNVSLRPENLFMARIGQEVDKAAKKRFTNLLFGITDD
jgi:acetoin utilization protein AcuA